MTVMLPTPDQLRAVADRSGLSLTAEDITSVRGLMQVGEHFDEVTIYRAAHAFERSGDWKKM